MTRPDSPASPGSSSVSADPSAGPSIESGTRYALFMLTVAYTFNFIDRQILVVVQELIKDDMGLSDTQLGLLSGFAFAAVYTTAGIPVAYWANRGNRRNIIALAVTVWSGMTALSGIVQNYGQLFLARLGVGIGEAGGSPPAPRDDHGFLSAGAARARARDLLDRSSHRCVLWLRGGGSDRRSVRLAILVHAGGTSGRGLRGDLLPHRQRTAAGSLR